MKRITTSSEFVLWMVYREHLTNDFHREDFFLAQICAVIEGLFSKNASILKYLIKFKTKEEVEEERLLAEEEAYWNEENASRAAQSVMFASMGIDPSSGVGYHVQNEPG